MRKGSLFTLLLGLFIFINQANAQLKIITGPEGSATHQMAQDIKNYCKIDIAISPTEKLVESFRNLAPGSVCFLYFDILQNELLNDLKTGTKNAEKADLLLPLGNEEIHLITLNETQIRDFAALKSGKKVGVGKEGETMRQTVSVIKTLTKSQWTDVPVSGSDAFKALLNKEIDAMFFIGNAPDEKLNVFSKLPDPNTVRLVPINEKVLENSYTKTVIRNTTYKWADYQVETYAAKLVLVAASDDDVKSTDNINYIKLLNQLKAHMKTLQRAGHPSWRNVSFVFDGLNWDKHTAAQEVFDPKKPAEKKEEPKKEK